MCRRYYLSISQYVQTAANDTDHIIVYANISKWLFTNDIRFATKFVAEWQDTIFDTPCMLFLILHKRV